MSMGNAHEEAFLRLLFLNSVVASGPYDSFGASGTALRASLTAGDLIVAIHDGDPGEAGTQATNEIAYTGYARVARARSAQTDGTTSGWDIQTPSSIHNNGEVSFGLRTNTGAAEVASHFSVGQDASGAGDYYFSAPLGLENSKPFALDDTTNDDFVCPTHGYSADDQVAFITVVGDALPTGVTEGTVYYVMTTGLATDTFRISASAGDVSPVAVTAVGSGRVQKLLTQSIIKNNTPRFADGALTVTVD